MNRNTLALSTKDFTDTLTKVCVFITGYFSDFLPLLFGGAMRGIFRTKLASEGEIFVLTCWASYKNRDVQKRQIKCSDDF